MPFCEVRTNIAVADSDAVAREISGVVATMLGKPESYVMVQIVLEQTMTFGGTGDPLCYMRIGSLGLPEERTKSFSATLTEIAQSRLDVPANRCYIEFVNPERHMWGFDGSTFG